MFCTYSSRAKLWLHTGTINLATNGPESLSTSTVSKKLNETRAAIIEQASIDFMKIHMIVLKFIVQPPVSSKQTTLLNHG